MTAQQFGLHLYHAPVTKPAISWNCSASGDCIFLAHTGLCKASFV